MNKGKRIIKIFGYGVISQVVTLLLGIIIPKLMIVSYGSEVNGLLSSIRQVFVYVALLEELELPLFKLYMLQLHWEITNEYVKSWRQPVHIISEQVCCMVLMLLD